MEDLDIDWFFVEVDDRYINLGQ